MKRTLILLALFFSQSIGAAEPYPWDLLKVEGFRKPYYAALGGKVKERWLAELPGPSVPAERSVLSGTEYLFVHSCKPHECDTQNIVLLYAPEERTVVGKLSQNGVVTMLGNPSNQASAELNRLYEKHFGNKK